MDVWGEGKTLSRALLNLYPSSRLKFWGCFVISVASLMVGPKVNNDFYSVRLNT